jgi:hypothetical protein
MKRIILLPLTFALLTACQESPNKTESPPYAPPARPSQEVIYEGASGLVNVQIANSENEAATLPSQISITFEKQNTNYEFLIVEPFTAVRAFLFSNHAETLFFGCDEASSETVLPLKIDAARVVLCGKIKVPANGFEMRASQLELRNVELLTVATDKDEFDYSTPNMLLIYTANLTVTGSNKLVLEGFTKGRERQRAPALFLNLAKVWGEGNFEIVSRSLIKIGNF